MKPVGAALIMFGLAVCGCTTSSPEDPTFSVAAAQNAASCHAVRGTITARVIPGGAIGTIHGDIQGAITTVQQPDPVGGTDDFLTGRVFHLTGEQTVEVTGGTIPELTGRTIVWTVDTRAVHLPPIRRVSNTLRLIQGATGNLVSHGTLDLTTLTTDFDYHGEVCP